MRGDGGFGGCPTTACVVVSCDKGFSRATFGSGLWIARKRALNYSYGELTNAFWVK